MLFSSTIFLFFFLPCMLLGYYLLPHCARNVFLFLGSLLFYAWGEPQVVVILLGMIVFNYAAGLLVDKYRAHKGRAYLILGVTVGVNIGTLFIFKYLNFVLRNLNFLTNGRFLQTNIALPIGISFFTFQALSYVVDIYRKQGEVQKNLLNVGLYIAFFPQLIAGPIVRYATVARQIVSRRENWDDFCAGTQRFILGLCKKVLLANSFAEVADRIMSGAVESVGAAWLGGLFYSLQIFYDFSAYSDMAIGLGRMFGFHFLENFQYPYVAGSITDFWRRWHISLSTWFRDYVYIPLGGSRVGKKRLIFNLFVVWMLTGIWHGASWNFVLWGAYYFLLLTVEKLFLHPERISERPMGRAFYHVLTLTLVLIGWVIFRLESLQDLGRYLGVMFGFAGKSLMDETVWMCVREYGVFLLAGVLFSMPVGVWLKGRIQEKRGGYFVQRPKAGCVYASPSGQCLLSCEGKL